MSEGYEEVQSCLDRVLRSGHEVTARDVAEAMDMFITRCYRDQMQSTKESVERLRRLETAFFGDGSLDGNGKSMQETMTRWNTQMDMLCKAWPLAKTGVWTLVSLIIGLSSYVGVLKGWW